MDHSSTSARHRLRNFVWEDLKYEIFCTRDEFDAATQDFEFFPVERSGGLVGVIMRAGTEIHLHGAFSLQQTKKVLANTLSIYGKATSQCPKNETTGQRILKMMGFYIAREDELDYFYEVTKQ